MASSPQDGRQQEDQPNQPGPKPVLDSILEATSAIRRDQAQSLVENFVRLALEGTITVGPNIDRIGKKAIELLDQKLSRQLAEVMHHPDFLKLEGTWRGFRYLVYNSETSAQLKIRVLNVSKKDLAKDLEKAAEFDQSQLFQKLYEHEFGTPGGEPYGALIGDYDFSSHPEDIEMLQKISGVCGAAHCPFIASASSQMFGMNSYAELGNPRDMERIFQTPEYIQWKSFRESEDSRWVTLTLPRALARLPYGEKTKSIEEFKYEETIPGSKGEAKPLKHDEYCWMNASFVMGGRLTDAFAKYGWCTRIRGKEGGGIVEGLPTHVFTSDDGDLDTKCPTEVAITSRRENELSKLGFLPLCHYKNNDFAVFFGGQSTQKPKKYDRPEATANAAISAGMPYLMASSRITHYLKVIARDLVGKMMERSDVEDYLKRWLANFVCVSPKPSDEEKARYPLAEANVEVKEIPGQPGHYNAVAHLRPWLYLEELTASMRLVASVPKLKG